jgi:hypothetical protein
VNRLRVLAAALLVVALTACPADDAPTPEDGLAATVDGARIAAERVEQRFDEIAEADDGVDDDPRAASEARARILTQLIINHVTSVGAADMGLEVDAGDVSAVRMELVGSVGGEAELERYMVQTGVSPERLDEELRALALLHRVGEELVRDQAGGAPDDVTEAEIQAAAREWLAGELSAAGVVVDDAYGRWDEQRHIVVPADPGRA